MGAFFLFLLSFSIVDSLDNHRVSFHFTATHALRILVDGH